MPIADYLKKAKAWIEKPRKLKLADKIFFVQQLKVMVKSGISLSVALKTLAQQTESKTFKIVLDDLQQMVEKGNLLSQGLEIHKKLFGELFINMIKAGEASGKLEDVMEQLFVQMKKDHEIIAKVRGAMIYPSIVVTLMLVIGTLVIVYVVPTISTVFLELNVELPLATRILIGISNLAINYGIFFLIGFAIITFVFFRVIKTPKGKINLHRILLKLPVVGPIIKKINIARFCRTLSSLLKTDIPIVQSFEITSKILGNVIYRNALLDSKEKIKKGISIQQSMQPYTEIFPPVVLQMISVGEETGSLDNILEESAQFYEEDVSQTMETLPSLIEPILMVILGIGVGGMALAVMMPLYSLSQAI